MGEYLLLLAAVIGIVFCAILVVFLLGVLWEWLINNGREGIATFIFLLIALAGLTFALYLMGIRV